MFPLPAPSHTDPVASQEPEKSTIIPCVTFAGLPRPREQKKTAEKAAEKAGFYKILKVRAAVRKSMV